MMYPEKYILYNIFLELKIDMSI